MVLTKGRSISFISLHSEHVKADKFTFFHKAHIEFKNQNNIFKFTIAAWFGKELHYLIIERDSSKYYETHRLSANIRRC